ncbi:MnmC family methyltransferase [Oligoflexus tunisiensis]|uniref:MnmC family methyltransferase n=1 Tax=Oligoflexus tunisiensis TaxID=708132 RepID=UPI00114D0262|nr:MnmC family methyltransferase [Oligoflexus tunisiensis]
MAVSLNDLVVTQDGTLTLRHPAYDEEFHSIKGARFEADSLYMEASGFRSHVLASDQTLGVLDVGLGLGYNALMTLECWMQGSGSHDLQLVSLEHTPELVAALADPQCNWKEGWSEDWKLWSQSLQQDPETGNWKARVQHPCSGRFFHWLVLVGDARLADLSALTFHYIWQDAFSPKKNPELWSVEWFEKLRAVSHPTVQLVTYSVARMVRDNLEGASWSQERMKTPQAQSGEGTGKKQWLRAWLRTT